MHEFTARNARSRTCICNCISFCLDSLCMNLQLGMSQDKRKHQTFDLSRKIHDRWESNLHSFVLERIKYQIIQLLFNPECACTPEETPDEPDECKIGPCGCDNQVRYHSRYAIRYVRRKAIKHHDDII